MTSRIPHTTYHILVSIHLPCCAQIRCVEYSIGIDHEHTTECNEGGEKPFKSAQTLHTTVKTRAKHCEHMYTHRCAEKTARKYQKTRVLGQWRLQWSHQRLLTQPPYAHTSRTYCNSLRTQHCSTLTIECAPNLLCSNSLRKARSRH